MNARILLVEDEPLIRLVVRELLKAQGYEVDEASNGEEGVRKYLEGHYDLLLVDYHLPALTGPEVISRIREQTPGCKAILLTGMASHQTPQTPGTEFLSKPFENSELLRLIHRTLG